MNPTSRPNQTRLQDFEQRPLFREGTGPVPVPYILVLVLVAAGLIAWRFFPWSGPPHGFDIVLWFVGALGLAFGGIGGLATLLARDAREYALIERESVLHASELPAIRVVRKVPHRPRAVLLAFALAGVVAAAHALGLGPRWLGTYDVFLLASAALVLAVLPFQRLRLVAAASDGVAATTAFGTRVIAAERLVRAEVDGRVLVITLATGGRVRVPFSKPAAACAERVAAAINTVASAAARPSLGGTELTTPDDARLAALERGGRAITEWRAAVRTLLVGDESYRAVPVARADVVRALEDTGTRVERRIGAALALRAAGDPEADARIRAAANRAARPVRVALERVLRDRLDERCLERALRDERGRDQTIG